MLVEGGYRELTVSAKLAVPTAAPVEYLMPASSPATIRLIPGSGGTLLCEYRLHVAGDWVAWSAGTVSAATAMCCNGPIQALRFTAGTAAGNVCIAQ